MPVMSSHQTGSTEGKRLNQIIGYCDLLDNYGRLVVFKDAIQDVIRLELDRAAGSRDSSDEKIARRRNYAARQLDSLAGVCMTTVRIPDDQSKCDFHVATPLAYGSGILPPFRVISASFVTSEKLVAEVSLTS